MSARAELGFAHMMRLVPRRYRFATAVMLARVTVPLFRRTRAYREQAALSFHCPREIALHLILNALTKNGTLFDLRIRVEGYEDFAQACAAGKGVLVIGHHAALTVLMVRRFYDQGFDPILVTPDSRMRVPGTAVTARSVQPSSTFLVQLRSRLRHGEIVCGMPDRVEHHAKRTIEFDTSAGRVIFAPAMIQVAARCHAAVVFTEVRLKGSQLAAAVRPATQSGPHSIVEEFIAFVRERLSADVPDRNVPIDGTVHARLGATQPLPPQLSQ